MRNNISEFKTVELVKLPITPPLDNKQEIYKTNAFMFKYKWYKLTLVRIT